MVCWEVKEVKVLRRSNSVAHFDHEVYPQRLSLDMALYGAHVEMGWFVIARLVDRRNCHLLGAQTACIACPRALRVPRPLVPSCKFTSEVGTYRAPW